MREKQIEQKLVKAVKAEGVHDVLCETDGYITKMNAEMIGSSSVILGAGRVKKDDTVDHSAGIILRKKTGDKVQKGDVLATLYTNKRESITSAEELFLKAITVNDEKIEECPLIYKIIS